MEVTKKLRKYDRKIIYILSFLVVIAPILYPLGLPVPISSWTKAGYDYINSLPDGSLIGVDMSILVSDWPAAIPSMNAVFDLLMSRNFKILLFGFRPETPISMEKILVPLELTNTHPLYGEKFVNLGYIPGEVVAYSSFINDIQGTCPTDYYGTPIEDLPIMSEFKTGEDFDLIWEEGGIIELTLGQLQRPYDTPMIYKCGAVYGTMVMAYYPVQLKGVVIGIRGVAEFETLIRKPGSATGQMDAISTSHIMMIVLILVGNVILVYEKKQRGKNK